jgi:hypothetical protein
MQNVTRMTMVCSALLMGAACAKSDQAAKDSANAAAPMATPAPAPAPPPAPAMSPADLAGKWQMHSVPQSGKDTTPTNFVLTARADTGGWIVAFPSGVKVPQHVTFAGDSVLARSDVFPSQRRKGMRVRTDIVLRMQNGKLAGMTTAHYYKAGADSVLQLRTEGTKMP